jgi:hypothetical protein
MHLGHFGDSSAESNSRLIACMKRLPLVTEVAIVREDVPCQAEFARVDPQKHRYPFLTIGIDVPLKLRER